MAANRTRSRLSRWKRSSRIRPGPDLTDPYFFGAVQLKLAASVSLPVPL